MNINGLAGMQAGFAQLDQAAQRIAGANAQPSNVASMAEDLVALKEAQTQVQASAEVMQTEFDMLGTLFDDFA